jgi:hypothetical protein
MKKGFFISFTIVMVLFFAVVCFAQQPEPGRIQKAPQRIIQINPNKVQNLAATVNRTTVLNSLMANNATRGALYSVAEKARTPVSQLATKGTDGKPAIGNPVVATASLKCQEIDYNAGIKFTPFTSAPMCRNPKDGKTVPLGVCSEVGGAGLDRGMTTAFPDLMKRNVLPLVAHPPNTVSFVTFDVLLPDAGGAYLVTVHVVPANNIPISDLVNKYGLKLIQTPVITWSPPSGMDVGPGGGPGSLMIPSSEIQLASVTGRTGFAGVMTPIADHVSLCLSSNTVGAPILFAGLTIMRL